MIDYEILLMLDPELPDERQNEITARVRENIEGAGGTWGGQDLWGRRKLAYEIDHKTDGVYHLLQFDAPPAALDEVARVLKITDGVMRHMATRRPKGGGRVAPPPPLPAPEPESERAPERASAAVAEDEAPPAEAEPADSEGAVEEYAEPTESEAPEAAPEEE